MRSLRLIPLLSACCALASCAQLGQLVDRVTPDRAETADEAVTVAGGSTGDKPSGTPAAGRTGDGKGAGGETAKGTKGGAGLATLPAETDATAAPVTLPESVDPELRRIYAEGLTAQKSGQYDVALDNWERVWTEAPEYRDVADLLLKEYLVRGLEQFAAGSLDHAIASWEKAQRIRPENPRVQAYLSKAREQRERTSPVE
ncbi:hypothetical protein K8I85_11905 [bacterium]|nr:hypothetical protein [bacterium]